MRPASVAPVWYELDLDARRFLDRPPVLVSLTPVHSTSGPGREWHPRYR